MNSPAPDFLPQLVRLAAGLPPPIVAAPAAKPVEHAPATPWPQIDALLADLAGLYRWSEDNLGVLVALGGGQIESGHTIVADHAPWSFNAEIAFREPGRIAPPAFVALDVEVLSGTFELAVLAADGSAFVGDCHTQRIGRALVQLPVFDQPVRGVIFRNAGTETGGRMRVHGARIAEFDASTASAAELRRRLEAEAQSPTPPEVDSPAAVPATLALGFHRLLAHGRIHEAARWLAAIDHLAVERPAWIDLRLSEILVVCHGEFAQTATSAAADAAVGEPPAANTPVWPGTALTELAWLRGLNRGAELIPLHQEILQALATLDLLAVARPCRLRFHWERTALATTPVRDGALSILCALLLERIRDTDPLVEVDVRTTPAGTTLEFRSPLDAGALQYRAHSMLGDELHRALHDPRCPLPRIEHRLGAESSVRISWESQLPAAALGPIVLERTDFAGIETLYSRADGHAIRTDGEICYKLAPPISAKPNDLVTEAALLQRVAAAGLAPEALAAVRTASGTAMSYRFAPGIMLLAWAARHPAPSALTRVLLQLTSNLAELNRRGVQHRDVRAENVLVDEHGAVRLLDFDQARATAAADDFGNEWATEAVCCGFGGLLGQLGWRAPFLRTAGALGFAWELGRFSSANSPGKHSCYYDWRWGGFVLHGERPWYQRWDLLRPIFEHRAPRGRFLELGCNLGLLSTQASLAGWQSRAVDHNALAVTAAAEIAGALGASAQFETGNLCDPALFAALGDGHDLVSALSVVHWLPDPAPVEAFLRRQRRLLFEGHRAINEEMSYLRGLGYEHVELLGYSERLRPLFYATRISP